MFDLAGRVAIVTGAGRGVGAGIATALAIAGARVAVNDLVLERAEAVAAGLPGDGAVAVTADVTDLQAVRAMAADVDARLGPIDILVNNAGIPPDGFVLRQFRDMAPDEWERFISVNLYGVLNCVHATLDGMCERGWGRVITISSEAGRIGIPIGVSIYGAAKGGAVAFMRHLATEVGPFGVTANCLSLGRIAPPDDERQARRYPAGRLGRPDDVAGAVVYLASNEAGWVTGQTLPVNGGINTS